MRLPGLVDPTPRLFRLADELALINRMGFPGKGADFVSRQLSGKRSGEAILGVNLGKNRDTPLEEALDSIISTGMDGVIATNTTTDRQGLRSPMASEAGGLSGEPLRQRSTQIIRQISRLTGGKLPIIGVGGVMSAAHVQEKLEAGAVLVQVYTGLVYEGPGLVKHILNGI